MSEGTQLKPKLESESRPTFVATPAAEAPVIPTSLLQPEEQRRLVIWTLGLAEVMKLWDILSPHFTDLPPTVTRLRGPWSAGLWCLAELVAVASLSLLRIPGLNVSWKKLVLFVVPLLLVWNLVCWFMADPWVFVPKVTMFGPVHLGEEGLFWGWLYLIGHILKRAILGEPEHITGIHKIRLLPYSTATLNPLSLTYCLPPASKEPTYIPIVFNNSNPYEVAYTIRSLVGDYGRSLQSIPVSLMKRPVGWQQLQLKDGEDHDEDDDVEQVSAIVARSKQLDLARLHSVRPNEALSIIPPDLTSSETLLFITVDKPSIISLQSVVDKRGDRFHIAPHREAVVIECPSGGSFVSEHKGKMILHQGTTRNAAPQVRCAGGEEVVQFRARGVAPLKVGWKKTVRGITVASGFIEGIEDESSTVEAEQGHSRLDRVTKDHIVPLRLKHEKQGMFDVQLTSVSDALGNSYTPSGEGSQLTFDVLASRNVMFDCPRTREILVNGTAELAVQVEGSPGRELEIVYGFTGASGPMTRHHLDLKKANTKIPVNEPGTFTLLEVDGVCPGTVLEPATCVFHEIPPPTAEMVVETLHECAMDVGIQVNFEFTGRAPFTVRWTEQRKGEAEVMRKAEFPTSSAQVDLRPAREGKYIYRFQTIGDRHYSDVPLNRAPIEQVVHPPASVDIRSQRRLQYWACSPDEVKIDLDVKGNDPLRLTYRTSWGHESENLTVAVKSGKQTVTVPVPEELGAASGNSGLLYITLMGIEDGKGCLKRLSSHQVEVEINRIVPTARFAKSDSVVIKEGESVEVPLRLTGHGPWSVVYTRDGKEEKGIVLRNYNAPLKLSQKGKYVLTEVKDSHCKGNVDNSDYVIDFKPRPSAYLVESNLVRKDGNTYRHKGLCAGERDAVGVRFIGASPFEIAYTYAFSQKYTEKSLKSAQSVGVLQLNTEPGRHRYQFHSIRDADYEKTPVSFVLEHEVNNRPAATFSKQNTVSLCRDTPLLTDAKLKLEGKPPFLVTLGVRRPASAEVTAHTVKLAKREWKVDLPDVIVDDIGRWEISLMSIADASGCDYSLDDDATLSTDLEVVETAKVVPIRHDVDLCVGDTLDFLLQGKAPWIVEYEWEGKQYTVTSSAARFSREAEAPGIFKITSIALKDRSGNAQCKRPVTGLERHVRPLPSARIEDGIDNLRDGDKPAVFTVSFTGTPPFTFTYTRSEGNMARVVETQTITDIYTDSYTISSSAPGDYTVTSVSDAFCRYPPLSRGRQDV